MILEDKRKRFRDYTSEHPAAILVVGVIVVALAATLGFGVEGDAQTPGVVLIQLVVIVGVLGGAYAVVVAVQEFGVHRRVRKRPRNGKLAVFGGVLAVIVVLHLLTRFVVLEEGFVGSLIVVVSLLLIYVGVVTIHELTRDLRGTPAEDG